ncbi:hypothetical protein [Flavobacterium daejeonense]|uniref:hypothetical protein n=1 Tax=Flavobacterium daejeonense TaxID=350893 RepID=UPI00047B8FBC|nr:hypothetical protein [Flavobacterium daejeonense]
MKKNLLLLLFFCFYVNTAKASYISYYLIHTGIDHQLDENKRQIKIKDNQAGVLALEQNNKEQTTTLKTKYAKIKSRLNSLGFLFDAVMVTPSAIPAIKNTIANQDKIIKEVQNDPLLIPIALKSEKDFVYKIQMISRFITGLAISYGDINQMKSGDRKMLLNHAIDEINILESISGNLLSIIQNIKMEKLIAKHNWNNYINREKDIIKEIMNNSKQI